MSRRDDVGEVGDFTDRDFRAEEGVGWEFRLSWLKMRMRMERLGVDSSSDVEEGSDCIMEEFRLVGCNVEDFVRAWNSARASGMDEISSSIADSSYDESFSLSENGDSEGGEGIGIGN